MFNSLVSSKQKKNIAATKYKSVIYPRIQQDLNLHLNNLNNESYKKREKALRNIGIYIYLNENEFLEKTITEDLLIKIFNNPRDSYQERSLSAWALTKLPSTSVNVIKLFLQSLTDYNHNNQHTFLQYEISRLAFKFLRKLPEPGPDIVKSILEFIAVNTNADQDTLFFKLTKVKWTTSTLKLLLEYLIEEKFRLGLGYRLMDFVAEKILEIDPAQRPIIEYLQDILKNPRYPYDMSHRKKLILRLLITPKEEKQELLLNYLIDVDYDYLGFKLLNEENLKETTIQKLLQLLHNDIEYLSGRRLNGKEGFYEHIVSLIKLLRRYTNNQEIIKAFFQIVKFSYSAKYIVKESFDNFENITLDIIPFLKSLLQNDSATKRSKVAAITLLCKLSNTNTQLIPILKDLLENKYLRKHAIRKIGKFTAGDFETVNQLSKLYNESNNKELLFRVEIAVALLNQSQKLAEASSKQILSSELYSQIIIIICDALENKDVAIVRGALKSIAHLNNPFSLQIHANILRSIKRLKSSNLPAYSDFFLKPILAAGLNSRNEYIFTKIAKLFMYEDNDKIKESMLKSLDSDKDEISFLAANYLLKNTIQLNRREITFLQEKIESKKTLWATRLKMFKSKYHYLQLPAQILNILEEMNPPKKPQTNLEEEITLLMSNRLPIPPYIKTVAWTLGDYPNPTPEVLKALLKASRTKCISSAAHRSLDKVISLPENNIPFLLEQIREEDDYVGIVVLSTLIAKLPHITDELIQVLLIKAKALANKKDKNDSSQALTTIIQALGKYQKINFEIIDFLFSRVQKVDWQAAKVLKHFLKLEQEQATVNSEENFTDFDNFTTKEEVDVSKTEQKNSEESLMQIEQLQNEKIEPDTTIQELQIKLQQSHEEILKLKNCLNSDAATWQPMNDKKELHAIIKEQAKTINNYKLEQEKQKNLNDELVCVFNQHKNNNKLLQKQLEKAEKHVETLQEKINKLEQDRKNFKKSDEATEKSDKKLRKKIPNPANATAGFFIDKKDPADAKSLKKPNGTSPVLKK